LILLGLAAAPTFHQDVAPLLYEHCAPCHRPGEAAPFSLLDYTAARSRAKQIAAVTKSRYMPPWPPSGAKHEFDGDRRLTVDAIRILQEWAAAGAPEGDPTKRAKPPAFVEGWQLGTPDLIVTPARAYKLASTGADVFRNFVLRIPLDRVRFVKAVEIRPGNKKIVHHANLLVDRGASFRSRDGADGDPGFAGMDVKIETGAFDPESHFLFWKPGTVYQEEPPGMSWRLDPGTDLILNMHLQPSGKHEDLLPSVGLYFTDQPPTRRPMLLQMEHDGALDIPPGRNAFEVNDRLTLPVDVDLLGVYPHAHYVGKDIQAWATLPDGTRRRLIHIPDWDMNWQAVYRYRRPVHLPKGTVISMRIVYDNSAANPRNPSRPPIRVVNGDRAVDEMAHLWLQILPRSNAAEDPRLAVQEAVMRRRLEKYPPDFLAQYSLGALAQSRGRLEDAIGYYQRALRTSPRDATARNALGTALQQSGRLPESAVEFEAAIRAKPDYADAHYNLARTQLATDQFGEAIVHLQEVIRINPRDGPALSDLGAALQATGKTDEGFRYLTDAVRVAPEHFNARFNYGQALAAAGRPVEAEVQFRAALALKPGDADTLEALRNLGRR